jgi:hypothetical protein
MLGFGALMRRFVLEPVQHKAQCGPCHNTALIEHEWVLEKEEPHWCGLRLGYGDMTKYVGAIGM